MKMYQIALFCLLNLNFPAFGMTQWAKKELAHQAISIAKSAQKYVKNHTKKIAGVIGAATVYAVRDDLRLAVLNYGQKWQEKYPRAFQLLVTNPLLKRIHYNSISEYLNESDRTTLKKRNIAQILAKNGIPLNLSQTEADLIGYQDSKNKKFVTTELNKIATQSLPLTNTETLNALFTSEKIANSQGKAVLYHAMPRNFYTFNYIGSKLAYITHPEKELKSDYLMLRQPIKQQGKTSVLETMVLKKRDLWSSFKDTVKNILGSDNQVKTHDAVRTLLLNQPAWECSDENITILNLNQGQGYDLSTHINKYLISTNSAITGNSHRIGENSLYYWGSDKSSTSNIFLDDQDIKTLFASYHIPSRIYEKYKDKFKEIRSKFINLSGSGVMLQFLMSPNLLDETTYPSLPFGIKRKIFHKDNIKKPIDSSSKVLSLLKQNPFDIQIFNGEKEQSDIQGRTDVDRLQFRIIADKSRLLDYKNEAITDNFSVKAYMAHQQHLDEFHAEIDKIMKELAEDLKK